MDQQGDNSIKGLKEKLATLNERRGELAREMRDSEPQRSGRDSGSFRGGRSASRGGSFAQRRAEDFRRGPPEARQYSQENKVTDKGPERPEIYDRQDWEDSSPSARGCYPGSRGGDRFPRDRQQVSRARNGDFGERRFERGSEPRRGGPGSSGFLDRRSRQRPREEYRPGPEPEGERPEAARDDAEEEEGEEPEQKRPRMASTVESSGSADFSVLGGNSNKASTQRNRRMFGMLMGHLQNFKRETSDDKRAMLRRQELEQKVVERSKVDSERMHKETLAERAEKKRANWERMDEIEQESHMTQLELLKAETLAHYEAVTKCIATVAEPVLFWSPANDNSASDALKAKRKDQVITEIKTKIEVAEKTAVASYDKFTAGRKERREEVLAAIREGRRVPPRARAGERAQGETGQAVVVSQILAEGETSLEGGLGKGINEDETWEESEEKDATDFVKDGEQKQGDGATGSEEEQNQHEVDVHEEGTREEGGMSDGESESGKESGEIITEHKETET